MSEISRRNFLIASTGMIAVPTFANVVRAQSAPSEGRPHIVLVHGAWHGAWAWKKLVPLLIAEGYPVSTLDLSGLGANAHRQAPEIGLHVHGQDVINHLFFNDLKDCVVVAHSYGGAVLSQAVSQDKEKRIAHAVYLDAFLPGKGESVAGYQPAEDQAKFEAAAKSGKMIPPRPRETWEKMWGLTGEGAEWSAPRMRPMSARCFTEAVQGDPFERKMRRTYMRCMQNKNALFARFSAETKKDKRFVSTEVDGHHNVMEIDPPTMRDALLAVL